MSRTSTDTTHTTHRKTNHDKTSHDRAAVAALVLATWAALWSIGGACYPTPDDPNPCEVSRFGCDQTPTSGLTYLSACPADLPPLRVEVGQGEAAFEPLSGDATLTLYRGSQGGQHSFLAVRVHDAALDLYGQLLVSFRLYEDGPCGGPSPDTDASDASDASDSADGADGADGTDTGGSVGQCFTSGERALLLGERSALRVVNGVVEEFGVLVFVDPPGSGRWLNVEATIEDPCRRSASARHRFVVP